MDNTLPSEIIKFNQEISKYFLVGSVGAFLGNILFEALSDLHCTMDNTNVLGGGDTPPPPRGTTSTAVPTTGENTPSTTSNNDKYRERVDKVWDSLAEPRSSLILHPDVVAQLKKNIETYDKIASGRALSRDEVLASTVFRRKYSEHFDGVNSLASKSLEEQQNYNALLRTNWQSAASIEMRKAFMKSSAALIESKETTTQSTSMDTGSTGEQASQPNIMNISNMINR